MKQIRTLYFFELKKIVDRKITWMIGGVIILLCIFLSFADLLSSSVYVGDVSISGYEAMKINREYARNLKGRVIDDTLLQEMADSYPEGIKNEGRAIINDRTNGTVGAITESTEENGERKVYAEQLDPQSFINEYEPIYSFMCNVVENEILGTSEEELYDERAMVISQNRTDQMLTEEELNFWEEKSTQIKTPFTYEYAEGWGNIWTYAYTVNYMIFLMIAICLSNMFSIEHLRKTDAIILCSQYGKKHLYLAKILAGATFGVITASLILGVTVISSIFVYGADGYDAALQLIYPLSSWKVSIGESIIILFGVLLIISVLYSVAVMVLSEMIKNSAAVMAVPVGIMILTMMIDIPYQWRIPSQIYDLLPTNLLIKFQLWDDRLVSVFGRYLTNFQISPLIYGIAVIILFWIGKRKYQRYQIAAR